MDEQAEKSLQSPADSQGSESQVVSYAASWRGPLPPPDVLRGYNNVFPGCAERIVAMAEAESQHRREIEKADVASENLQLKSEITSERTGMWLAFTLAVLVIGLSGFLLYTGRLAWGVGLIGLELVSLAGLFIYGRHHIQDPKSTRQPDEEQISLPFPK